MTPWQPVYSDFLALQPNKQQGFGKPRGRVDKFTLLALIPAFQAGGIEINAALMTHRFGGWLVSCVEI